MNAMRLAASSPLFALALVPALALAQPQAARAQDASDIYLAPLNLADSMPHLGAPVRVTNRDGYDNQPSFTPDGRALLYTSIDSAGQADIFRYDIATRASKRLTRTSPESEYSAGAMADGTRFSVVRVEADSTQRLWSFDLASGGDARLVLPGVKPVGYYAWGDDHTLVLFVLGDPATLQVVDARAGGAPRVVARDVGRSIQKVPGQHAVSFVQHEADSTSAVALLDLDDGGVDALVATLPGGDFHAWTPDGTLLMASGSALYAWRPGFAAWRQVADLGPALAGITRIAVAPNGRSIALVAAHKPTMTGADQ